jgi:excisionase family DNA binding protein
MNSSEILDFREAQEYLGISRSTLLRWIRDGRVQGYKAGRKWKFYHSDLESLLLKEPQAVYSSGLYSILLDELQKLGLAGEDVDTSHMNERFWCDWQDREGWLWLSCMPDGDGYELYLQPAGAGERPQSWRLTPAAGRQMLQAWQTWSGDISAVPTRPGRVRRMLGAAGGEDVTLYLTRHIDTLAPFEQWCIDTGVYTHCRKRMQDTLQDWLITGPPNSVTAFAAYTLARLITECNPGVLERVSTCETDYTCFLPGAIQVYPAVTHEPGGVDTCILQLASCSDYPARGIRSPRVRIGYSFTVFRGDINISLTYHVHIQRTGDTWCVTLP